LIEHVVGLLPTFVICSFDISDQISYENPTVIPNELFEPLSFFVNEPVLERLLATYFLQHWHIECGLDEQVIFCRS